MSSEARHLHPQAEPLLDARLFPADFGNLTVKVERLARKLAESAVERDRRGGHARAERELIRDSGLLNLAIPQRFDGAERPWPEIYRIVRHLAAADSSLAHLFAFNHLQVATVLLHGSAEQQRHWLAQAGCQAYQGYLFSKPLPAQEVEQLMQSHISAKNAAGTGADGLLAYSI